MFPIFAYSVFVPIHLFIAWISAFIPWPLTSYSHISLCLGFYEQRKFIAESEPRRD